MTTEPLYGSARNIGLQHAKGDYIIFLDSDDELDSDLLKDIENIINTYGEFDILAYNFSYCDNKVQKQRKDMEYIKKGKEVILEHYLKLHMDGSVIFTCFNKKFLDKYEITFRDGLHEDVDFLYKAYNYARKIECLDKIEYYKNNREDSIVNTLEDKHILGYFEAWNTIVPLVECDDRKKFFWKQGIIAIAAIKIRQLVNMHKEYGEKSRIYKIIRDEIKKNISNNEIKNMFQTKYVRLVLTVMEYENEDNDSIYKMELQLKDILKKVWSCWDIENSLFLGDSEIRICCKRFFVGNEKKGDVVLAKLNDSLTTDEVFQVFCNEKKRLKMELNQGEKKECIGCPYLHFDEWEESNHINKLSFEYHSVCNLRCVYCSEKYYGGKKAVYDVKGLIDTLIANNMLDECESIVWGGGEPTLDKDFSTMLNTLSRKCIKMKQHVITNASFFSEAVAKLLKENRITMITSIDAGTRQNYQNIRGNDFFYKVLSNLKLYADCNSDNMIIKYIILNSNCSLQELQSFVKEIRNFGLCNCTFQISCNFNKMSICYEEKLGAIVLYCLLKEVGIKIVYFDELLRERICVIPEELVQIREYLNQNNISDFIASEKRNNIVIWGSDNQIRSLLNRTIFFSDLKPMGLIAGHSSYIGKFCNGLEYKTVDDFRYEDVYVVIAAVQGTGRIYEEYEKRGLPMNKIIDKLIL